MTPGSSPAAGDWCCPCTRGAAGCTAWLTLTVLCILSLCALTPVSETPASLPPAACAGLQNHAKVLGAASRLLLLILIWAAPDLSMAVPLGEHPLRRCGRCKVASSCPSPACAVGARGLSTLEAWLAALLLLPASCCTS